MSVSESDPRIQTEKEKLSVSVLQYPFVSDPFSSLLVPRHYTTRARVSCQHKGCICVYLNPSWFGFLPDYFPAHWTHPHLVIWNN
jgi:hypothetical protein